MQTIRSEKTRMEIYVLTSNSNFENIISRRFSTKSEAVRFIGSLDFVVSPNETNRIVVSSEEDLLKFSSDELIKIYNSLGDSSISRFSSKEIGANRILAVIRGIAEHEKQMLKNLVKSSKPKEKKEIKMTVETDNTKATRVTISRDKKINLSVTENPRRQGTKGYESFSLIRSGMKVSEYLEKGGRGNDLIWDIKKGYVTLVD